MWRQISENAPFKKNQTELAVFQRLINRELEN